jgi:hypothetical protein
MGTLPETVFDSTERPVLVGEIQRWMPPAEHPNWLSRTGTLGPALTPPGLVDWQAWITWTANHVLMVGISLWDPCSHQQRRARLEKRLAASGLEDGREDRCLISPHIPTVAFSARGGVDS